jgi:hypothetical protein
LCALLLTCALSVVIVIVKRSSSVNIKIIIRQMEAGQKAGTIICSDELPHMKDWHVWTLLTAAFLVLLVALRFVWSFSKKTQLFPLKGRAPRFVVIQLIYFFMMNFVPLITEVFLKVGVSWEKERADDIPMTRQFLKSIYFLFRMWCYLIYVHR